MCDERFASFLDFLCRFRYGAPQFALGKGRVLARLGWVGVTDKWRVLARLERGRQHQRLACRERAMRKSPWLLFVFVLLGGLLGGIFGEVLQVMAPKGTIQSIFSTALTPGINPPFTVDLVLLKVTFGFVLKMNLLTFLGMFLGIYLYKQA